MCGVWCGHTSLTATYMHDAACAMTHEIHENYMSMVYANAR